MQDSVEIIHPAAEHTATLVLLHGYSGNADSIRWFTEALAEAGLETAGWKFILPCAPRRRITIYAGKMERAWHDYLTDSASQEPTINEQHMREQRLRLHQLLSTEIAAFGGSSDRVFVAGYSQGGCVALDAAITFTSVLGGVLCRRSNVMSCSLRDSLPRSELSRLAVCAWHGREDTTIEAQFAGRTYAQLAERPGIQLDLEVEDAMDHFCHSELEMENFAKFLKGRLQRASLRGIRPGVAPKQKSFGKTLIVSLVVVVWSLLFVMLLRIDE